MAQPNRYEPQAGFSPNDLAVIVNMGREEK